MSQPIVVVEVSAQTITKGDLLVEGEELLIIGKVQNDGTTVTVLTEDGYRIFAADEAVTIVE